MGKGALALCIVLLVFFGLPIALGVQLPKSLSPDELGNFLGGIVRYWLELFQAFWNALRG